MAEIPVTLDADKTVTLKYARAKYTLTTRVLAGGAEVGIPDGSTIDGRALEASMSLDPGTYSVTVPDQIVVSGTTYRYSSHT